MAIIFKIDKYQKHDTLYINKIIKNTIVSSNSIQLNKLQLPNYTFDKTYKYNNIPCDIVHIDMLNDLFKYIDLKIGRSKSGQEELDQIYSNMVETMIHHSLKGMVNLSTLELIVRHKYLIESLTGFIKDFLIESADNNLIDKNEIDLIFFDILMLLTSRISLILVASGDYHKVPDLTLYKTYEEFTKTPLNYQGIWWQR